MQCHTSAAHKASIGSSDTSGLFPGVQPGSLLIFKDIKKKFNQVFFLDKQSKRVTEKGWVMWGWLVLFIYFIVKPALL